MWKKGHITFLTHTDIEPAKLISILRQSQSNLTSKNDKKIFDFVNKKLTKFTNFSPYRLIYFFLSMALAL